MKKRAVSLIICMAMVGTIMACGNNAAPLEVVDEAPQAISVVEESTESEETDTSVSEGNSDAPAGEEEKETVTIGKRIVFVYVGETGNAIGGCC